jgi:hypothetical protein
MTDASIDMTQSSLLEGPDAPKKPEAPVIAQVATDFGVHPLRQMREIFSMRYGAQKLGSQEYYNLRLFNPDLSMAEKRTFLGQGGTNALNTEMNPPVAVPTRSFVGNKLLYTELLAKLGIATSETQALVSTFREFGALPVLRDAQSLATFLREKAVFPIFGKPHHGSLSEGSVRIQSIVGDTLHLADGREIDVDQFATDVMRHYPGGFMLQTALDPHAEMAKIAGLAVGCVRVVTANDGSGPKPAYALWKLPAPKAMSDNFWQEGSLLGMLDLETGTVTGCQRGSGIKAEFLPNHPTSGAPVIGVTLPFWQQTLKAAVDAHSVFPEFGVCGFDIAVTPEGPKVLECNDNPAHMLYQLAAGRGIQGPELSPIWERVVARQKKQLKRMSGKK